jgi:hypothetical protein
MAQYAVSYVTGNEWVSGGADGSLQVRLPIGVSGCKSCSTLTGKSKHAGTLDPFMQGCALVHSIT